jgi:hypothetical protein
MAGTENFALPVESQPVAVDYVRAGLALIPIPLGSKGPRLKDWQLETAAIRDEAGAATLTGCNIGLAHRWCGTCAVDVDDYKRAAEWLAERGIELMALLAADDAVQIRSGRPNRAKLLYRLPPGLSWLPTRTPEGAGLELRCASRDGLATAQDVLPPSIHPETGRPYEWVGDWRKLPTLPAEVLSLWQSLVTPQETLREGALPAQVEVISKGGRNSRLASLAGSMRRQGMTQAAIEAALLAENAARCAPPLEDAEVRCIAASVARYEPAQPDAWPAPKPIIAELKPVPAFDADTLLPEVLRAWVMDEAERMPCPPEFIAAAALVALGSIIGARCAIKPKARDSWLIVPNLWGGIVGDPSAKKSPAWGAALKPLDKLIAKAQDAHRAALADYETEMVVFDAQKDAIEGRIKEAAKKPSKGDPTTIARELRAHGEQAPRAPVLRRYKTNDSTVEKLGELLRENPGGVLVLRDELVGLIATWEREGREGDRAFFLEAWNGNQSFDTDRIGRGHIAIPNLCVSIFGGIQPDKLTVYLEQAAHALANDGMLQRFQLLVYPDPRRWEWRDRAPNKAARDAAMGVFERLAELDAVLWGAMPADDFVKFPWFRFDDEAQAVFIEWSEDLHGQRMANEDEPIIQQHLAKFDKLFPALALIFHLVECAAEGVCGPVTKDAALRAAAWCEFLEAHARRCYGLLKDDGLRAAQALAAKLERGALEDGFTLRDVRRNQWRNLTADSAIEAALDWLEDVGWLRSETSGGTGPGSGRRTVRYRINPAFRDTRKRGGT